MYEIKNRGYLIHFTHYDPVWVTRKEKEKPFDLELGKEIIDALAENGFNVLVIDLADGVEYKSHPELKRHYTVPMSYLKDIVNVARSKGLEIVPKLNFSQSEVNQHNHWFRPYHKLDDNKKYWETAFEIIDEVISVCKPERLFHIGMDEDTHRNPAQYTKAVNTLCNRLKARGLRTMMWNDSAHTSRSMMTCVEKAFEAEQVISKDIVQVPWDYVSAPKAAVKRLTNKGFEVWAAPGANMQSLVQWREVIAKYGCKGMLMTKWIPVNKKNREALLKSITNLSYLYNASLKSIRNKFACPVLAPNYIKQPLKNYRKPYLPAECFITNWMILGPFRFNPGKYRRKEQNEVIDDSGFVNGKENMLVCSKEGTRHYGVQWKKYVTEKGSLCPQAVDLTAMYGKLDYSLVYCVANVYSSKDVEGYKIYVGSDDYIKLWLNGVEVFVYNYRSRSSVLDNDKIENLTLRKGWNTVVVKCVNIKDTWDFFLRFANEKNEPVCIGTNG